MKNLERSKRNVRYNGIQGLKPHQRRTVTAAVDELKESHLGRYGITQISAGVDHSLGKKPCIIVTISDNGDPRAIGDLHEGMGVYFRTDIPYPVGVKQRKPVVRPHVFRRSYA